MTTTPRTGDQTMTAQELARDWEIDPRWRNVRRDHTAGDVVSLAGPVREERTLARRGAETLWELIEQNTADPEHWVRALGALTGNQAVQQVRAGLQAIYLSGWQVAADANLSGKTYPDQSLYPVNSVPAVVRRINNALRDRHHQPRVDGPDRRRCGGRLRRPAERLRADALDDRGRGGGRALGGPAGQ